jgi:sugar fermentation stimulation protein A
MQWKMRSVSLFPNVMQGRFIRRLNRFTVECLLDNEIVRAHLPNPGRLWELLLPDRTISLVRHDPMPGRYTIYTAVAVLREDMPVLLHTQMANTVVKYLLDKNRIRGLEHAKIIKQEATFGKSRFDFLLQKGNVPYVLEVKSCTLFGKDIAMFPDAVTERGRRHLLALAELTDRGMRACVIFVVHWPHARFFLPDYHTDFDFARTFADLRDKLLYRAVSVTWNETLTLGKEVRELEIPWGILDEEARDSGCYMLILHVPRDVTISIGSLGPVTFSGGYYIYVGSAKINLTKRLERHLRKRKKFFWHVDYLRNHAETCIALPIRSHTPLEHEVAFAVGKIADWSVPGFGSSDCYCGTHLFAMHDNPVHSQGFIDVLQHFRMDILGTDLH